MNLSTFRDCLVALQLLRSMRESEERYQTMILWIASTMNWAKANSTLIGVQNKVIPSIPFHFRLPSSSCLVLHPHSRSYGNPVYPHATRPQKKNLLPVNSLMMPVLKMINRDMLILGGHLTKVFRCVRLCYLERLSSKSIFFSWCIKLLIRNMKNGMKILA